MVGLVSGLNDFNNIPISSASNAAEVKKNPVITQRILDALNSGKLSKNKKQLVKDFAQITPDELKNVLTAYFDTASAKLKGEDPSKAAENLAELIPFEKLEKAVYADQKSSLIKAKSMLHQAKYYLENSEIKASSSLKSKFGDIIDSILSFVESTLSSFGVADLFKPATTHMQREAKFQKIMMLVSFFSMLTAVLFPLLGVAVAGPIIGGAMLLIGVISVIYPHIAPAPSFLPNATNWTKECKKGKFEDVSFIKGRKEILDEMASTLIKSQKGEIKKHPLLKGESRVGKNQTVKAFVQAIEKGDYPELKGKQVFYVNAAELCKKADIFDGKDPLDQISEAMGRHRENIILVIDEIHVAFQGDKNSVIGQKLKSFLDAQGNFPYVIGITTSNEFQKYISCDEAFVNRFNPIDVKSTDSEVSQEIMAHYLLQKSKSSLYEKDALKKIYEKTKAKPQPYSSRVILDECIRLTSEKQTSPLKKKIQEHKNSKEFLASQNVSAPMDLDDQDEVSQNIAQLEEQIYTLEKQLAEEQRQFDHLFQIKEKISRVKAKTYQTVLKVSKAQGAKLSNDDKVQLNSLMLLSQFIAPALDTYVKSKAKELGVKVVIDDSVIEEAMKEPEKKIS